MAKDAQGGISVRKGEPGNKSLNRLRYQVVGWTLTAVLFVVLAAFVSLTSAIIVALFGATLLLEVDVRLPLAAALALLIICPVLLALKETSTAEAFANWCYFLFAIAVVAQLIRYVMAARGEGAGPAE
jgi:hypothetical protein